MTTTAPRKLQQQNEKTRALWADQHLINLERLIVGTCLDVQNSFGIVSTILQPDDFSQHNARIVYESIFELYGQGRPIDIMIVYDDIKARGFDQKISIVDLLDMVGLAVQAANLEVHCRIVKQASMRRKLFMLTMDIAKRCNNLEDIFDTLAFSESGLGDILKSISRTAQRSIYEIARTIEKRAEEPDNMGFYILPGDTVQKLGKAERGDMITIAGRPGMGKSTLSTSAAVHVAVEQNRPVLIWSLEMPAEDVLIRMICNMAELNYKTVKYQKMTADERIRYTAALDRLSAAKIVIMDDPNVTMSDIRVVAFNVSRTMGLDMVVIDYGGLLNHMGNEQHRVEIGKSTRLMKQMSKELGIVTLHLYQLNKEVDKRPDKRPYLHDLKESGDVEADSDRVIFLWRPEYYHIDTVDVGKDRERVETKNAIILLQDKYRNGEPGYAVAKFYGYHFQIKGASGLDQLGPGDDLPF